MLFRCDFDMFLTSNLGLILNFVGRISSGDVGIGKDKVLRKTPMLEKLCSREIRRAFVIAYKLGIT